MNSNDDLDDDNEFGMFTPEGNTAVAKLVADVLAGAQTLTETDLYACLSEGMRRIGEQHAEVWDTAVREEIIDRMEVGTGRDLNIRDLR